ncbi:MAG: hypothetical protein V8Q84_10065 [Bilophila sp.]
MAGRGPERARRRAARKGGGVHPGRAARNEARLRRTDCRRARQPEAAVCFAPLFADSCPVPERRMRRDRKGAGATPGARKPEGAALPDGPSRDA